MHLSFTRTIANRNKMSTRRGPFNSTPMGVNSIPPARLHVRPMGVHRTCRWAGEIKKNTHPKKITALYGEQGSRRATTWAR